MTGRWRGDMSGLACLALALVVHAGAGLALIAAKNELPPEPESAIELDLTAATTSDAIPAEIEAVAAAPEQAEEAQEVVPGDAATVVAVEAPAAADTPPPDAAEQATGSETAVADNDMPAEPQVTDDQLPPATDVPPAETAEEPVADDPAAETAEEPASDAPAASIDAAETAAPAASMTAEVTTPVVAVPEAAKIVAAETFTVAEDVQPRAATAPDKPDKPAKERSRKDAAAKKVRKKSPAPAMVAGAREQKRATQTGTSAAARSGGSVAASSYRSAVAARINGRKGAIAARVPSGARGTVVISFVIGPGGAVNRSAVRRSSGVRAIDAAALTTISSTKFPPPPEGSFAAVVPIRID